MKLYIPSKIIQDDEEGEEKKEQEKEEGKENEEEYEDKKVRDAVDIREEIYKISNSSNQGDAICVIPEVQMITPRGKINVHFLKQIFKITGPSHDYKIPYQHINKAIILPRQDGQHFAFVVGLTSPMRQGNTNYPFIVFQIKKGTDIKVNLNLPEKEEERAKLLKQPIESEIEAELHDVMVKLFNSIIGIKINMPKKFKR